VIEQQPTLVGFDGNWPCFLKLRHRETDQLPTQTGTLGPVRR